MAGAHVPEEPQRIMAAVARLSFPVSTALTLVLLDWQGTGEAQPLWAFALPTVVRPVRERDR